MSIAFQTDEVTLHHGDCIDVMRVMPDASVDAIVTDPPYGLSDVSPRAFVDVLTAWLAGDRAAAPTARGFMGKSWDAFVPPPAVWDEAYRLLKPGGHLLAFAGSRTDDLMGLAIRLAGFEIRDGIAWLYGSGFPKSLDVAKAIELHVTRGGSSSRMLKAIELAGDGEAYSAIGKNNGIMGASVLTERKTFAASSAEAGEWEGWGTALKPAFEPIVVARKPLAGTVAANVLAHGTGALNIGATRIGDEERVAAFTSLAPASGNRLGAHGTQEARRGTQGEPKTYVGRFPANVVLDEHAAEELDEQSGVLTSGMMRAGTARAPRDGAVYGRLEGDATARDTFGDSGGASRFFYTAKADSAERPVVDGIAHPTVKPLDLMRWLVRLVTSRGGVVLEPFAGSGTTLEAAVLEGFRAIGIEREADYIPLIEKRLDKPHAVGLDIFGGAA